LVGFNGQYVALRSAIRNEACLADSF